jgi:two-component system, chemotaxis family, protein-glutamate methylesterase/glutaminase
VEIWHFGQDGAIPTRPSFKKMPPPIRVLLADDSETLRRAVKALLRSEPSVLLVAEICNYQELLATLRKIEVDVVVMDVHMPDSEHVDPQSIKDQLGTQCLLAISFANDQQTSAHAKNYGAVHLLDKIELARTLIPAILDCRQQESKTKHV